MLIDSHCHLDHYSDEEMPALLDRAATAALSGLVTIGTRLDRAPALMALARRLDTDRGASQPRVWCTIGTHPDHVAEDPQPDPETIAAQAEDPSVVGIGESGLDYFHGAETVRPLQQARFRAHIRAARLTGLPLVIHARQADDDVAAILRDETETGGSFRFVLHCFSSGAPLAKAALDLGGYVSFSGILTFPKSHELRDIAAGIPADRLLVETDAPYLAPVPYRGRRNEPSFVAHTAQVLAATRGLTPGDLAALTTANFHTLFTKAR